MRTSNPDINLRLKMGNMPYSIVHLVWALCLIFMMKEQVAIVTAHE